jgi:hypothetical protein
MEWRPVVPATPALATAVSPNARACWWQDEQLTVLFRLNRLS